MVTAKAKALEVSGKAKQAAKERQGEWIGDRSSCEVHGALGLWCSLAPVLFGCGA